MSKELLWGVADKILVNILEVEKDIVSKNIDDHADGCIPMPLVGGICVSLEFISITICLVSSRISDDINRDNNLMGIT